MDYSYLQHAMVHLTFSAFICINLQLTFDNQKIKKVHVCSLVMSLVTSVQFVTCAKVKLIGETGELKY